MRNLFFCGPGDSQNKALSERHMDDSILIDKAWSRVKEPDSILGKRTLLQI